MAAGGEKKKNGVGGGAGCLCRELGSVMGIRGKSEYQIDKSL